jgi:Domain of unknown function (DUF222)/HNH endonuclease
MDDRGVGEAISGLLAVDVAGCDRAGLGELCETADGTPLPPETVRRLACEAAIVPIVLNSNREVLDCGRDVRVANRAQRRALRAMYRTCGYPGCDVTFDRCDIHHVIEWIRHGTTDLDNLLPLCSKRHHFVHEGHWRLTLGKHRVVTIHRPDGTRYFRGPTINRPKHDVPMQQPCAKEHNGGSGPPAVRSRATADARASGPP